MIEDIKRFIDENHIFIVIIIVLCLCLFYWYIYCKSESKGYKVSSGDVFLNVVNYEEEEEESGEGKWESYYFIGAAISKRNPLFVLNGKGHELFDGELGGVWRMFYDCYLLFGDDTIMNGDIDAMMKNPVYYITEDGKDDKKATLLALWGNAETFFNKVYDKKRKVIAEKNDEYSTFVFSNFIPRKYITIADLYSTLAAFINEHLSYYFEVAEFIGQPASEDYDFETLTVGSEVEKLKFVDDKEELPSVYVWDCKDMISNLELYRSVKTKLRSWYNNKEIKVELNHLYEVENGIIKRLDKKEENKERKHQENAKNENEKTRWQIADIFPAFKLIKTVFVLLAFETKYIALKGGDSKNFRKMVASYVVYVHLFNSFCGVKMEEKWNKDIGNIYVYKYKDNANVQKVKMDPEYSAMASQIGESLGKIAVPVKYFDGFLKGVAEADPSKNGEIYLYKVGKITFEEKFKNSGGDLGTRINVCMERFDEVIDELVKLMRYADQLITYYKHVLGVIADNMARSKSKKKGQKCFVTKKNYAEFETFASVLEGKIVKIRDYSTSCEKIAECAANSFVEAFCDYKESIMDSPSQEIDTSGWNTLRAGGKTECLRKEYNLCHSTVYDFPIIPENKGVIKPIPEPGDDLSEQIIWETNEVFDALLKDYEERAEENRMRKKRMEEEKKIDEFIKKRVEEGKSNKAIENALSFIGSLNDDSG